MRKLIILLIPEQDLPFFTGLFVNIALFYDQIGIHAILKGHFRESQRRRMR